MCTIKTVPGSVGAGSSAEPGTPWHPSPYRTRHSTPGTTGTADNTHTQLLLHSRYLKQFQ